MGPLERLRDGGYLGQAGRIKATTIQALAECWLDVTLDRADIRSVLAAARLGSDPRHYSYSVPAILHALEDGGSLQAAAARTQESIQRALDRVRQYSESEPVPRLGTTGTVPGLEPPAGEVAPSAAEPDGS